MLTISALVSHAEAFITSELAEVNQDVHSVVRHFAQFVEGKEAEADAVKLLTDKGYTVTSPNATKE